MKHQQLSRANGTKRPFLLALIAFSLGFCHYAEAKVQPTEAFTSNVDSLIINDNNKDKDETIYEAVDEMPKFPGGTQALFKYLGENIQYPEEVQKLGIAGRVITQFVISKKGEITSVAVVRSLHPELDKQAIQAITAMPTWTPGKKDGKVVNVKFTLPINFHPTPAATTKATGEQQPDSTTDKVFMTAQKMPRFPKEQGELDQYLKQHITYWKNAAKQKEEGRVIVTFIVRKDGQITDARVVRSVSPTLDAEALRIISNMPKWEPGENNGVPVSVKYTIPILFRLR